MEEKTYRKYDKEFKQDAVKLVAEGGRSIASVSSEHGKFQR